MLRKRITCLLCALAAVLGLGIGAKALEVDCDTTYCFRPEDFGSGEEALTGVCITGLPDPALGTAMLGSRVLQPGDILTADQLAQLTFAPLMTESDREAIVTYLPIYENRVEKPKTMTINIRGRIDQAPAAQDMALETYKNLPNSGKLKVVDPEGQALTYTVTRQPKRGTVTVDETGSFTYTPKKNKVGVDSFVYTATDPAGNVSREATVTVRILKPTDATQYSDTVGTPYRFAAEWMKNTGLFVGETISGERCFQGDKPVSRGEFLAMAIQVLGIPMSQEDIFTGYSDTVPQWLRPYLAAALRSGLTVGLPVAESGAFGAFETITGGEAAVILQNALDLSVSTAAPEENGKDDTENHWAAAAVAAMNENGIAITLQQVMTRGEMAQLLYQISMLTGTAPGLQMYQ